MALYEAIDPWNGKRYVEAKSITEAEALLSPSFKKFCEWKQEADKRASRKTTRYGLKRAFAEHSRLSKIEEIRFLADSVVRKG